VSYLAATDPLLFWKGNLVNVLRFPLARVVDSIGERSVRFAPWSSFLRGALVGTLSLAVVHPLDVARTRLALDIGPNPRFRGLVDCLCQIYHKEGMHGLYAGFLTSVMGFLAYRGLYYILYGFVRDRFVAPDKQMPRWLAAAVGFVVGIAIHPLDTVRRRMMMQSGSDVVLYENEWNAFVDLARYEVSVLWKGWVWNVLRGVFGILAEDVWDEIEDMGKKLWAECRDTFRA